MYELENELFARSAAVAALHRTPKSEMDERMKHEKTLPSCKFQILQYFEFCRRPALALVPSEKKYWPFST